MSLSALCSAAADQMHYEHLVQVYHGTCQICCQGTTCAIPGAVVPPQLSAVQPVKIGWLIHQHSQASDNYSIQLTVYNLDHYSLSAHTIQS